MKVLGYDEYMKKSDEYYKLDKLHRIKKIELADYKHLLLSGIEEYIKDNRNFRDKHKIVNFSSVNNISQDPNGRFKLEIETFSTFKKISLSKAEYDDISLFLKNKEYYDTSKKFNI